MEGDKLVFKVNGKKVKTEDEPIIAQKVKDEVEIRYQKLERGKLIERNRNYSDIQRDHDLLKLKLKYYQKPSKYLDIYDYLCEISLLMPNKEN